MSKLKTPLIVLAFLLAGVGVGIFLVVPAKNWIAAKLNPPVVSGDFSSSVEPTGKSVVMFSSSTCPFCKAARDFFELEGISYQDNVIDRDSAAKAQYEKLGLNTVPIIFTKKHRIRGFEKENMNRLFRDDGILSASSTNLPQ